MSDKKNDKSIFNTLGNNFVTIITVLFSLQIANFLSVYLFMKSKYMITLMLFFMIFLAFGILKDFVQEDKKKSGFKIFKIAIVIFVLSSVNHVMCSMANSFDAVEKTNSFFRLSYFLNFAFLLGSVYLLRKDEVKEVLNNIYENSILEKLHIKTPASETKQGDIQLCINKDTNKPVVIPHKDRYLHMLILGPTGSGKTSQILLPMINQDMQNHECGITVIEPKADLAEKVYAMAKHYKRKVVYFNPVLPECPSFNPFFGYEDDVIENMATTFKMLNPDSPQFFQDMNEQLIRNSLKVLKRLMGNKATLIELSRLVQNSGGVGRKMVTSFSRLNAETEAIAKENADIASWFLNEYFNEKSKTYEHCSGLRSQIAKITSNTHLRQVLNPENGESDIDFQKHLAEGGVIAIATAQGALRDLGRFLGYFLILNFQSAVFKRPAPEDSRRPHFLYIDEFQTYSNPGFGDMLTQGRSYRVGCHLATQNRALMAMGGGQDGKNFVELVSTNARHIIIFPGGNAIDAKYYSDQFGEILKKTIQKGISRAKFNPIYGIQQIAYPNESIRETEAMEARFSPSDIIYREFGEITYCIIQKNTIQPPGVGKIEYIPEELNKELDRMIADYTTTVFDKTKKIINSETSQPVGKNENIEQVVVLDPITTVTNNVVIKDVITTMGNKKPITIDRPVTVSKDAEFSDNFEEDFEENNQVKKPENNENSVSNFDFMSDEEDELI
ncbi:MAG: TraG/TraD family [Clostridiaceae bacterium]|jgi:hypothetical protein|nr:TraG/TraD family [Clostridiaceae bacterium]